MAEITRYIGDETGTGEPAACFRHVIHGKAGDRHRPAACLAFGVPGGSERGKGRTAG